MILVNPENNEKQKEAPKVGVLLKTFWQLNFTNLVKFKIEYLPTPVKFPFCANTYGTLPYLHLRCSERRCQMRFRVVELNEGEKIKLKVMDAYKNMKPKKRQIFM